MQENTKKVEVDFHIGRVVDFTTEEAKLQSHGKFSMYASVDVYIYVHSRYIKV